MVHIFDGQQAICSKFKYNLEEEEEEEKDGISSIPSLLKSLKFFSCTIFFFYYL